MGNANSYSGMIRHGEGGMKPPMSASVGRTNKVKGKVESSQSPKAVDRSSGKPSSGNRWPAGPMRGTRGMRGQGD